jgi:glycerol-3-phosphate O-acyltransferase
MDSDEIEVPLDMMVTNLSQIQVLMKEQSEKGNIRLDQSSILPPEFCIQDAINKVGVFHSIKPLKYTKEGNIGSGSLKILYFYHNRLDTYDFLKEYWNLRDN